MASLSRVRVVLVGVLLASGFQISVHGGAEDENGLNSHHSHRLNLSAIQEVTHNCSAYCTDQVQYNSICVDGCKEWEQGLREGCGIVCNGREGNFREFHACQVGCSKVVEDYYFYITGVLGVPDPPTLISSTLKDTSLGLVWDGSLEELPHLVFTVQKKTFQRNQPWETLPTEPLNTTTLTVTGLRPYTEYQFRIGWIIAQDFPPLYSLESIPIVTIAKGLPNPPEITSIQPISNTSVSITWLPPSQPNGPLIAYILKLQSLPDGHLIIKEIPIVANQNQRGYTFSGLLPYTNYSLAISSVNRQGEGDATHFTFPTPQSPTSNDISKRAEPKLLIQGIRDVYLQAMDLLLEPEVSLFVSNRNVTGMSAHFRKNLVFIATADGEVIRTRLGTGNVNETQVILSKTKLDIQVSFLSVDWLHDKLYLVGKKKRSNTWSIRKADLNGARLQTVLPNIGSRPVDFMADPYTGYLYWVAPQPQGTAGHDGLYKMDLIENEHFPTPVIPVLEEAGLGPFTIDFANYRILIVQKAKNTVLSVTLDGEQTDIRDNTHSPHFEDVVSIGNYGGVFYWTTGNSVGIEEYNEAQKSFYHNSYEVAKSHQPSNRLLILHPSLQPIPSPMAPPQSLHGVFSQRKARIVWRPPPRIAGLGDGSWSDWSYEVRLSNNVSYSGINETQFLIENLQPSTEYSIQVLAYSASGQSPLTSPFRGHTLRQSSSNVSFFWASESGLYGTDALGDSVKPLLFPSSKDSISSMTASSFAIFFSLTNGSVFQYPFARSKLSHLDGITFAHSISFDPTGQKIYWSNPKKQAILRASVHDAQEDRIQVTPEYLPVVTTALEITLDSARALLIWTTGHSIEISRLNGRNQQNLVSVGLFSGIRILSVSVDTEAERIFWLTRSSTGSALFQMNYNRGTSTETPKEIARFEETSFTGPIRFFSERLLVLQSGSQAMIQELNGGDSLIPIDSISNITHVLVVDEEKRGPVGSNQNVTPSGVLPWSISLNGKWDIFTISWQAVSESRGGAIFYDISINDFNLEPTSQSFIRIDNRKNESASFPRFSAYTEIEISITAATFWASSKPTVVKRRTPSGKPSEPLNPRIFLERISYPYFRASSPADAELIGGELRWDSPEEPNGVILGYLVHCWKEGVKASDCSLQVDLRKCTAEIKNLTGSTSYQFAIQGYTDAGVSRMSRRIQVETDNGSPLAKLLLTAGDKVQVLDIDRNGFQTLTSPSNPHTIAYLALDETLFWFDEGQYLMRSRLNGTNKTRIHTLKESVVASNLVVNWIARKLFWISESAERKERYSIEMLDLGEWQRVTTLVNSSTPIMAIAVNPFTSSILWTTSRRNGIVTLYSTMDDGGMETPFLSRQQKCNCSRVQSIGDAVAFDGTGLDGGPSRGILFNDHGTIWLADEDGCNCFPLVNFTGAAGSSGIATPFRLTSDKRHVYWISPRSSNSHTLYAGEKGGSGITQLTNGVGPLLREVGVLGPSAQPFPQRNCLIPLKLEVEEPVLLNHSAHSLTLRLPRPETLNCSLEKVSTPSPSYSVYYGTVDEKGITACTRTSLKCAQITNGSSVLRIDDLHPYTSYTLFLSVSSYYAQQEGLPPIFSSPVVFTTAPGAPMPPKLLSLRPLTPAALQVRWAQPEKLNGGKVWYAVEWEAVGSNARPNHTWAATDAAANQNNTEFMLNITTLRPGSNYAVWVVAYSEIGDEFSKSEIREIQTFTNPNNMRLILATPHQISISWTPPNASQIIKHQFVYRLGWSSEWNSTALTKGTVGGQTYNVTVDGLKPKTMYGFRIKAWYAGDPSEPFYWPLEQQLEVETLADKPGPPGLPIVRGIGKSIYEVSWAKSEENGAIVDSYSLECRLKSIPFNDTEPIKKAHEMERRKRDTAEVAQKFVSEPPPQRKENLNWFLVYNGTENRWEVTGLDSRSRYEFRVRSKNVYGWSDFSRESSVVSLGELLILASEPQNIGTVFGIIALGVLTLAAFGLLFIYVYRRKQKEKPTLQGSPTSSERREVELATLRELPSGVHQNNILYAADLLLEFDSDSLPLQKVKRNQITLLTHLGSGAFGDVYEGYARTLHERHPITGPLGSRVAIKTLRKGATTKEKLQFVEEARLMGQFHHPHILELLGICIDADPCLILELMSGGDLLSHLRSSRLPPTHTQSTFTFGDLLQIALHVARGCVYLEEKHFVHRDLAARNCLVRITVLPDMSQERVVKIGDFGLARDVYRNDYYRKEGEGLLPVRWMPPESLVDGVFTTQSDVWSFGVLLWEILTLGHQPYPARSNVEVLNYVRTGGRLQDPPNSPPSMTWLMFSCWEYEPQNRPTFKDCLQHLERIAETDDREMQCQSNNQLPHYQNASPFLNSDPHGEASELEGAESPVFSPSPNPQHYQEGTAFDYETRPQVPFPKYLELLGSDSENVSIRTNSTSSHLPPGYEANDGYEIPLPRKPPRGLLRLSISPEAEIGLPSPPPYANTRRPYSFFHSHPQPHSRTLLASTTSEEEYLEMSSTNQNQSTKYAQVHVHSPSPSSPQEYLGFRFPGDSDGIHWNRTELTATNGA